MDKLGDIPQIVARDINSLMPYGRNPRINDSAVEYVANSIREFGWKVPVVIDRDGVVIAGHTRLKAARKLGIRTIPCIIADDLTEEQAKAFRLADNKVSELAEWDFSLLEDELTDIVDLDMGDFGFDLYDPEAEHEANAETTQHRVANIENIELAQFPGVGRYDIPQIEPVTELPPIRDWIGFNYVLSDKDPEGKAVHFFIDDYQFERIWNAPDQ